MSLKNVAHWDNGIFKNQLLIVSRLYG